MTDTSRDAVEAMAQRMDSYVMPTLAVQADCAATLRALLARSEAAEAEVARMRAMVRAWTDAEAAYSRARTTKRA